MKKLLSLFIVSILMLSITITAYAETPTFSKDFESYEYMLGYIEQYSVDYPDVEYANGGTLTDPIKNYELKYKEILTISVDNPEFVMTELSCGEAMYNYGVNYTQCRYTKNNENTINIIAYYYDSASNVMYDVNGFASIQAWDHEFCCPDAPLYIGEISGYHYEAFCYTSHDGSTRYRIAADDVLILCTSDYEFDEVFIENLVIEKSGVTMPVLEYNPSVPIKVTDEVLRAAKKEYDNSEITKEDITVYNYVVLSDSKILVRLTVSDYEYETGMTFVDIGSYRLIAHYKPLPQILIDDTFYDLDEAYNSGLINDDDLKSISKINSNNFRLAEIKIIYGDVNNDGKVTVLDVTHIQRYLCGYIYSIHNYDYADFDRDGQISILDATAIQRQLADL